MKIGSDVIEFPVDFQPTTPVIQQFGDAFEDSDGNVFRIEKVIYRTIECTVNITYFKDQGVYHISIW